VWDKIQQFIQAVSALPNIAGISPWIWIPVAAMLAMTAALALLGKVPPTYVLGNLAVRWRTTLMTGVAFALVICLLTFMLAFVNGMYALTKASGRPDNLIILSEGATDEGFSNLGYGDVSDIESQPGIVRINDSPLVSRETYLVAAMPIAEPGPGRPNKRFLQLRGIDDPAKASAVHGLSLYDGGKWFSDAGVRATGDTSERAQVEVVIGEGIARQIWQDQQPAADVGWLASLKRWWSSDPQAKTRLDVGDSFAFNERVWLVTGVMKSSGSTFDSEVWAKNSLLGPMFGKETYTTLIARAESAAGAKELEDYFDNKYTKSAVATQVETDYFASLSETNVQFLVAIGVVTFFMAIGGLFGVMNTMYATISQRIKDIGVLRLLGFKRRHILATFLLESVLIGVAGGVLGCLIGSLCDGWTANSIVSGGPGGGKFVVLKLTVDAQIIAVGMGLTLLMGLLGGLLPSLRAMRMTALETLR
jgi:putative ABC transport system permease protein